jgi:pyruvate kinase
MASGRKGSEDSGSPVFSPGDMPKLIAPSTSERELLLMAPSPLPSESDLLQLPGRQGRLYSTDATLGDLDVPHLAAQMANTRLENLSLLDIFSAPHVVRNTGLICTIGPASNDVDKLVSLIEMGLCIARLNFSHGTHEYHAQTIVNVREAITRVEGRIVAIALDTKGPEIRTGLLKGGGTAEIQLKQGDRVKFSTDKRYYDCGDNETIYVDYVNIVNTTSVRDLIFIDDGLISVMVIEKGVDYILAEVQNGGKLGSKKGVNLPGKEVDLPAVSEKDVSDLKFGVEQGVDMVFASFIRKAADVDAVRSVLGDKGKHILIVSKIESEEGVKNFEEIMRASDGIMVARGDLGIEIPPEKVFIAQKMMIARCNRAGKPVIVATQMLESMVEKPRPTRAEASDVANAVLDGADCVMLSGETAKGKYPLQAVKIMSKIALEAEAAMFHRDRFNELRRLTPKPTTTVQTTAIAAVDASFAQMAAAIITLTTTGRTAFVLSQYRPRCPIIAVTRTPRTARICHLYRGVHPLLYETPVSTNWFEDVDQRLLAGLEKGRREGYIFKGSTIVLLSGWRPGPANINTIRIFQVAD